MAPKLVYNPNHSKPIHSTHMPMGKAAPQASSSTPLSSTQGDFTSYSSANPPQEYSGNNIHENLSIAPASSFVPAVTERPQQVIRPRSQSHAVTSHSNINVQVGGYQPPVQTEQGVEAPVIVSTPKPYSAVEDQEMMEQVEMKSLSSSNNSMSTSNANKSIFKIPSLFKSKKKAHGDYVVLN
jgi:hypothetical protein